MKPVIFGLLIPFVFLSSQVAPSQDRHPNDLNTLLRDASYVVNRFDETTTGLDVEIDSWNIPASSKQTFKDEVAAIRREVGLEKPRLNSLLGKTAVSSTDLFDVYEVVSTIGSELGGQASYFSNWGNEQKGIQMAQLGAKAVVLGANIGVVLRFQIADQELRLEMCALKTRSK